MAESIAKALGADIEAIHESADRRGIRGYARSVLDAAHDRGIVHGDVKSDNFLIDVEERKSVASSLRSPTSARCGPRRCRVGCSSSGFATPVARIPVAALGYAAFCARFRG